MKKNTQRLIGAGALMVALSSAAAFNASNAEAASKNCAMVPFVPVTCALTNAAGVALGAAGAQDQPVVDFLGAMDQKADALNCRAKAFYPGVTKVTGWTTGLPLNTSAYPAGSAAGWYAEPGFPMTSFTISCI